MPTVVQSDEDRGPPDLEMRKAEFWNVAQSFGVSWDQFEKDWAEHIKDVRKRERSWTGVPF